MKRLLTILILTTFSTVGFSQTEYPTGLVMDDEEYNKLPFTSSNIQIETGQKSISSKVDLSPYCPEIRHQGDIASCVGWSAGYGAMTIERAIKNGWTDKRQISENANSALFIYNQINLGNCDMGITMPKALNLIKDKGNCLARDFDIDPNNCTKPVTDNLYTKAEPFRIEDYIPLFKNEAEAAEKIRNTKLVLAQNKPVIIGMRVLNNFYDIREGDSSWFPTIGNTGYAGGHAMVVVGYDDNRFARQGMNIAPNMRGAFKLMNSWGKNWGERGFIWVRYAHFAKHCKHAYAIMLADGEPIDFDLDTTTKDEATTSTEAPATDAADLRYLSGAFGFRQFTGIIDDNGPVFNEIDVNLEDGFYTLQGHQKAGDVFQLYVKSGFDNGYIYVFSVDATGKAEVHFPKSQEYNQAFQGKAESAMLLSGGSLLTIPAVDSGLRLTHRGKDHLVALFSTQKIRPKYIQYLCTKLSENKENPKEELLNLLQKFMVPTPDITYQRDFMGFDVGTRSEGKIIPILLTVEVN
ncbi:MAG: C1 family peptidase [Bacteroidota bacterium]